MTRDVIIGAVPPSAVGFGIHLYNEGRADETIHSALTWQLLRFP